MQTAKTAGCCHSVETFGTVDGPGVRYVLFLAGCNLQCRFCHNPDTWAPAGKAVTSASVLADYENYRRYYQLSGGGLTVSGGEPLLQAEFVAGLFRACREKGIHTVLDTAGFAPPDSLKKVIPWADAVQFSLKAVDAAKHRQLTGHANRIILDNLRYAAGQTRLTVRYVIIPGINNSAQDLADLAQVVHSLPGPVNTELLAYHVMGRSKWAAMGLPYALGNVPAATAADLAEARRRLEEQGITVLAQE